MAKRHAFLLPFFFLLLGGLSARAQSAFQVALPGVTPAGKRPVVQTSDGGFCVLTRGQNGEEWYFVLVKIGANGAVEWSKHYKTPALNDHPVSLGLTPDGGFIAVGNTSVPNSHDQDILALRLDKEGDSVWSRTYNYSLLDWASDIAVLKDGSAVIVGSAIVVDTTEAYAKKRFSEAERSAIIEASTRERTIAFRIDPNGEVLWGGFIKGTSNDPERNSFKKGFAQAVCTRSGNMVSIISQETQDYSIWSSLMVNLTDRGEASSGLCMQSIGTNARPILATFANDLAPLSDGSCLVAGVHRYYTPELNAVDQGFLISLNRKNQIIWSRTYTDEEDDNPLPLSVALIDDNRIMLAGRTLFADLHYPEGDNPVIVFADKGGKPVKARQWITSMGGLPITLPKDPPMQPFLWWPRFIPTDDKGVLSVGEMMFGTSGDYAFEVTVPVTLLNRFNPDLTACKDQTREAVVHASLAGEEYTGSDLIHRGDWNPTDITSNDYRTVSDLPPSSETDASQDSQSEGEEFPMEEDDIGNQSNANDWSDRNDLPDGSKPVTDPETPKVSMPNEEEEGVVPRFSQMKVALIGLKFTSQVIPEISIHEAVITPWFLCGKNP